MSKAHERYHVSLFFSRASRSNLSSVRLSTCPVRYLGGGAEGDGEDGYEYMERAEQFERLSGRT